jgi:hypothetical protein
MTSFALITEGITDQAVLETLLYETYSDVEEPNINPLQPVRDATDEARAEGYGGWERVMELCAYKDGIVNALTFNDFIIIQIDTDCADHQHFGVQKLKLGAERPVRELIQDVRAVLIGKIDKDVFDQNKARFIFAVSVHSIECWLLPVYAKKANMRKKTIGCENRLKIELARAGIPYSKTHRCYLNICTIFDSKKILYSARNYCESLDEFLKDLPAL